LSIIVDPEQSVSLAKVCGFVTVRKLLVKIDDSLIAQTSPYNAMIFQSWGIFRQV